MRADRIEAARAPLLGKPVQVPASGEESLGHRAYQRREIELIYLKHLLYSEKYTIEGARQKIDEHRKAGDLRAVATGALRLELLESLEQDCREILRVIDGQPTTTSS